MTANHPPAATLAWLPDPQAHRLGGPEKGPRCPLKKDPGVLKKGSGVLKKDPGVLKKDPGVFKKDPGVLLKDPGVP